MSQNEKTKNTPEQQRLSRRRMMHTLGGAAAGLAGLTAAAGPAAAQFAVDRPNDVDILNFALNLEYLEAEFYRRAIGAPLLDPGDTFGPGRGGPTVGGRAVPFTDELVRKTAVELALDEQAHVRFLRRVLGPQAVAKPFINLEAPGFGFRNQVEFLVLSRNLEDTGVSAYGGAAPLLRDPAIIGAAARILATEAYHAGNIRFQVVEEGIIITPIDPKDQPPSNDNFFPTDENGLAIARTVDEVLRIVRPFFPEGLNGFIR